MRIAKRRGIGNVIATAIMVFLVVFTVAQLYTYNIDELDNYNQVAAGVSNTQAQRLGERIAISNVVLDNSGTSSSDILATLTVTNTGGVTSRIVAIWFDNVDQSTALHRRISENAFVGQGLSATFSNLDTGIAFSSLVKMTVRVATALGNSISLEVLPPGLAGTTSSTLATTAVTLVPPNPITSNTMSVVLTAINNNQLGVAFTSLQPDLCVIQGGIVPLLGTSGVLDSGKVTATVFTATTTIFDTTKAWGANVWAGDVVVITAGTGAGQSRVITSNTASTGSPADQLTVNTPWTTFPDTTSQYAIMNNCHKASPAMSIGSSSCGTCTTILTVSGSPWTANQWANYIVQITAGSGSGNQYQITSNTANVLTIQGTFSPAIDATSKFAILGNLCTSATGVVTNTPVGCTVAQSATPSSMSFLPYGATALFQWQYQVTTILADAHIIFAASYVNLTTYNLQQSPGAPLTPQGATQQGTIRQAGGASSSSGGNFAQAFGSLINYFTTFQWSSDGTNWNSGFSVPTTPLMFRVNLTNTSSKVIAFNSTTQLFLQDLKTGASDQFYIMKACVPNQPFFAKTTPGCTVQAYPSSLTSRYLIGASQTITLYFGATAAGGSAAAKLANSGRTYQATISMTGSQFQGGFSPISVGGVQFTASLLPGEPTTTYTAVIQTGWVTNLGTLTKNTGSFTQNFNTAAISSTTMFSTVTWGVYCVSPCSQSPADHSSYGQSAPFFTVGT